MYWTLILRDFTQLWEFSNMLCSLRFNFLRDWVLVTVLSSFCPLKCFAMSCYHFLQSFCLLDVWWESRKWKRTVCFLLEYFFNMIQQTATYLLGFILIYNALPIHMCSHGYTAFSETFWSQCFIYFQLLIFPVWSWNLSRPIDT